MRRTPEEALFGRLLQTYHYLGYRRPVGEHVKYLVYGRGQPIACLSWSSAPRHLGPRDRFIGWSAPQRRAQIHLLAGLEGVLTRIGSQYKLYVSVTLLQRSVSVEVDADSISVVDRDRAIVPA